MSFTVRCPSCAEKLVVPSDAAGKRAKCGKCGTRVEVPTTKITQVQHSPPPAVKASMPSKPDWNRGVAPVDEPRVASQVLNVQVVPPPAPVFAPPASPPAGSVPTVSTTDCMFCGETILAVAKKCKHCGELLDPAMRKAHEAERLASLALQRGPAVNVVQNNVQQNLAVGARPVTNVSANGALACGIIAAVLCWMPCAAIFALAAAGIGIILAVIGVVEATAKRGEGLARAMVSGVLCAIAGFVGLVVLASLSGGRL